MHIKFTFNGKLIYNVCIILNFITYSWLLSDIEHVDYHQTPLLQGNAYNYRDSQFINSYFVDREKPKLRELVNQFEFYPHYKQLQ